MGRITRWEPFREMRRMHDMLDSMMDRAMVDTPFSMTAFSGVIPLDVFETPDEVIVKATTPGFKPDDIEISITGDTLSIRGEIDESSEDEGRQYFIRERRYGSFSRSIKLPTMVDSEKANAEFENGILTLTLPKVEEVKPKTITVKAK